LLCFLFLRELIPLKGLCLTLSAYQGSWPAPLAHGTLTLIRFPDNLGVANAKWGTFKGNAFKLQDTYLIYEWTRPAEFHFPFSSLLSFFALWFYILM
jgi:hypothetical protein